MSDLQLLFLILALLYLWECLAWLRRGSVAFSTWLGRNWRLLHPGVSIGNQEHGFILASPLPPMGFFLTSSQFPLSLSPEGALVFVSTSIHPGWRPFQSGKFVAFSEIRGVRARHKKIIVNSEVLLKCPSARAAGEIAAALQRLGKLPQAERAVAIEKLIRRNFDMSAAKARWREYRKRSVYLRWLVNLLFVYLFLLVPLLFHFIGFRLTWPWALAALLALTVLMAVLFRRGHRALYPREEDERFAQTLTIALSPATAMRAHDLLSRPLLETFHPLVPARLLLDDASYRAFARHVLLDARNPILPRCPSDDASAVATELHWRTVLRKHIEDFLQRNGLNLDQLSRPPGPADETCRSYCPRCLSQYTAGTGACADCGGLPLVAFGQAPPKPA